jgi:pimeloyl-ACP methyl ester carboxylesterase
MQMLPIVYLPGGGGRSSFWRPVGDRLWRLGAPIVLGYPGFGDVPPDPSIHSAGDLYDAIFAVLPERFHLVAQSMGNVFALRAAIEAPQRVASLTLCAVSGGIDVRALGGAEWRESLKREMPDAPTWFIDDRSDFTGRLGEIRARTLVLSPGADSLSPLAVGEFLVARIPSARVEVLGGGSHSVALEEPDRVAALIGPHIAAAS